jgi:hypothetical protein
VITEPEGFRLEGFEADGAAPQEIRREGIVLKVRITAAESREIGWTARFKGR